MPDVCDIQIEMSVPRFWSGALGNLKVIAQATTTLQDLLVTVACRSHARQQTSTRAHLVDNGVCLARGQEEEDNGQEEKEQLHRTLLSGGNASSQQEIMSVTYVHTR